MAWSNMRSSSDMWIQYPCLCCAVCYSLLLPILWWEYGRKASGPESMSFGRNRQESCKQCQNYDLQMLQVPKKNKLVRSCWISKRSDGYQTWCAYSCRCSFKRDAPERPGTLLAKAVAGEAGVPFFSISEFDFVEMFVGVGYKPPCSFSFWGCKKRASHHIFIDEIDTVGRQRGCRRWRKMMNVNKPLNNSDWNGWFGKWRIIVITATNRSDVPDQLFSV